MNSESPSEGPDEFEGLPSGDRRNLMGMRRAMLADGMPKETVANAVKTQYFVLRLSHELGWLKESDYSMYLKITTQIRDNYQKSVLDVENKKHAGNDFLPHLDANQMFAGDTALVRTVTMPGRVAQREDMIGWLRGQPAAQDFLKVLEKFHQFKPD